MMCLRPYLTPGPDPYICYDIYPINRYELRQKHEADKSANQRYYEN
jgi:hypothetical protein